MKEMERRAAHSGRAAKSLRSLTDIPRSDFTELEQLQNVGSATAGYLRLAGVSQPSQLTGCDPYALFEKLCRATGRRFDPCLLDQFIAAVGFMDGGEAKAWWEYTEERKRRMSGATADKGGVT